MSREITGPVKDVEIAFGTTRFLPAWKDIPKEFKDDDNLWHRLAHAMFFGRPHPEGVENAALKPGLEVDEVRRIVRATFISREPKHEHKMAGVAYLLSTWFEIKEEK